MGMREPYCNGCRGRFFMLTDSFCRSQGEQPVSNSIAVHAFGCVHTVTPAACHATNEHMGRSQCQLSCQV